MSQPTFVQRDAASVIFNLPGYRVIQAIDLPLTGRRIKVVPEVLTGNCPDCGSASTRIHQWYEQVVKDQPAGESVQVVVCKPRLVCSYSHCARRTFTLTSTQLPARARCTTRLRHRVLSQVVDSNQPVDQVARLNGLAWWSVQKEIYKAVTVLPNVDERPVKRLGIDEHRYRKVRWFRDQHSAGWRRVEPWMSTIVNADSGQVLGIVDGRDSAAVGGWLTARSKPWREGIEVVCIDPSAPFKKAITTALPKAQISVDPFHLVLLANKALTAVRQRLSHTLNQRRGRKTDRVWAHRQLLLRGYDSLSQSAKARLMDIFATDDPTGELGAAWGIKEQLRRLLAAPNAEQALIEKMTLGCYVVAADMAETWKLYHTIETWWPQIEVLLSTGLTNARTEAANTTIKHIKRTGRGYRNSHHYQGRILLHSARAKYRRSPIDSAGHHA